MKKFIRFLRRDDQKPSSRFSEFFVDSSVTEKKRILKKAIKGANKDQSILFRQYNDKLAR